MTTTDDAFDTEFDALFPPTESQKIAYSNLKAQEQLLTDLKATRIKNGVTEQEAADFIGITLEVFQSAENGGVGLNLTELRHLALAAGAKLSYIVE